MSGKDLETKAALGFADSNAVKGITRMATHGSSTARHATLSFLGERDLAEIRDSVDEIDAVYGAALDAIVPAVLVALTERPRAA